MNNLKQVAIVGPLPPPIGGVSSHILRLLLFLADNGFSCTVLDGYPAETKMKLPGVNHLFFSGRWRFLKILFFLCTARSKQIDVVHLHFSHILGNFLLFSLLLKRNRKVILTLHHGDQLSRFRHTLLPLKLLSIFALHRMDLVVALSTQQLQFFRSLNIPQNRLVRWETAMPLHISPDSSLLPDEVRNISDNVSRRDEIILITSGYPTSYYGFYECIELLDIISSLMTCRLIVSLYGTGSDPVYEKKLRASLLDHPRVILVGPLPAAGFAALLLKASLYIRPSTIDSYGLAITDALNLGVPCVASDVCSRDSRCVTFPVGNKDAFFKQALSIIELERKQQREKKCRPIDISKFDEILSCYK